MIKILNDIVEYKKNYISSNISYYKSIKKNFNYNNIKNKYSLLDLLKNQFVFIAEAKKGSPSAGLINNNFNPEQIGTKYQNSNLIDAVSVLTDEKFFFGSLNDFHNVRKIVKKPILRKEFIIDEYQVFETKLIEANILLLIAEILSSYQIYNLYNLGKKLNLDIIIEIHSIDNLKKVYDTISPDIIGINNRNLNDFSVDINNTFKIQNELERINKKPYIISESGIKTKDEIISFKNAGINGVLIGTTIMKSNNIDKQLRELF